MTNASLILDIQKNYDERTREQILTNLNIAISLEKNKGLEVDRYRALPKITNRSKHSVMSWFNRPDKKIPLIDLCMIAQYLKYNIYSFFTIKENCEVNIADFLIANDYNNAHYPVNSAEIFVRAFDLQYATDKNIVIDNLEKFYKTSDELLAHHDNSRQVRIMELCNCTLQTYYAWFNRSRMNVRIPLASLCLMADDINIDIFYIFEVHKNNE